MPHAIYKGTKSCDNYGLRGAPSLCPRANPRSANLVCSPAPIRSFSNPRPQHRTLAPLVHVHEQVWAVRKPRVGPSLGPEHIAGPRWLNTRGPSPKCTTHNEMYAAEMRGGWRARMKRRGKADICICIYIARCEPEELRHHPDIYYKGDANSKTRFLYPNTPFRYQ